AVLVLLAVAVLAWAGWTVARAASPATTTIVSLLVVLAASGGALTAVTPNSAASVLAFVAVVVGGIRLGGRAAAALLASAVLALACGAAVWDTDLTTVLAYVAGLIAATFGGLNRHQSVARAEQTELLLAETQRSREEQLRAAALGERTRIAREIHDVLAHALSGLAIQIEATRALVERDAERAQIVERLTAAHALAREGLDETRRAVGALRGDAPPLEPALRRLLDEHRAAAPGPAASLVVDDAVPDEVPASQVVALVRTAQEALTNARKHAPGAAVAVRLDVDGDPGSGLRLTVEDDGTGSAAGRTELAVSGGGYGLRGMRERAEILGGRLTAGPRADGPGWRVMLTVPASGAPDEVRA
ncbi:MAG: sensor histidine kinase, partial [Patulibacter sp.]